MDTALLKAIQASWDQTGKATMDDVVTALIDAGATPVQHEEIFDFIHKNAAPLELGMSPEAIFYEYQDSYHRMLRAQDERRRLTQVSAKMDHVRSILESIRSNEGASVADLKTPIGDLNETISEIADIVAPPRIDFAELIAPDTKAAVVARIKEKPEALKTSYELDGENLLFQTGALSVIAAPTGHGKTAFLLNLLLDAASRYPNLRHWLFSYEESSASVIIKALSVHCKESYSVSNRRTLESYYRKGTDEFFAANGLTDFKKKEPTFWEMVKSGIINVVQADYATQDLIQAIREVANHGAGFIGIDYLQLLYPEARDRFTARQEELKRICLDLKDAAIETGLPIVAAAQFNREVRYPGAMEPQRLADASDIEKAANLVVGLWNGDKRPGKEGEKDVKKRNIVPGTMYLEVLKSRDGKSNVSALYPWDGNRGVVEFLPLGHKHESNRAVPEGELLA